MKELRTALVVLGDNADVLFQYAQLIYDGVSMYTSL